MQTRFMDTGRWLGGFAGEFLVRCPQCDAAGTVRREWQAEKRRWEPASFSCLRCGHTRRDGWAGPVYLTARRRCGTCGRWLDFRRKAKAAPGHPTVELRCDRCQAMSETPVSVWRVGVPKALVDDCFGLPLWLQAPCAGHTLWAFNAGHLAYLEAFPRAGLRERRTSAGNKSVASRLPFWLKQAKHRDEVLRAVRRLEALIP